MSWNAFRFFVALALILPCAGGYAQIISTTAGGDVGDGGQAKDARINFPYAVTVADSGDVYIADTYNSRIRMIAMDGTITTVAGNGTTGYSGDGGQATSAQLDYPRHVSFDSSGNMYIPDSYNHVVRKVATNGVITTVAGDGTPGYSGDGGQATSAQLNLPAYVTVDSSGNLYISDRLNNRIREVDTSGVITTVAGDGTPGFAGDDGQATSAQLNGPYGTIFDSAGNLYIADSSNHRIRRIASNGIITTVAGTGAAGFSGDYGPATSAQLNLPYDVAVDSSDNLYVADQQNNRIRKIATNGTITTAAGTGSFGFSGDGGPATNAELSAPIGVAVSAVGDLYIADTVNQRIRKVANNGPITTVAGSTFSGDGGPAVSAKLFEPSSVALEGSGNLYIADTFNQRIRKIAANGIMTTVAGNGSPGYSGDDGQATGAQLDYPTAVAIDMAGNVYIADTNNNRIRVIATNGTISTVAGNGGAGYSGDGGQATSAQLNYPYGVAIDGAGNIYIADTINVRVRKVAMDGTITTVAGNGNFGNSGDGGAATSAELAFPTGVALDGSGNLYIADAVDNVVRKVDTNGMITTVAGNGNYGYSGDGGPATSAQLAFPENVAFDSSGNMYIADAGNQRIRMVDRNGTITTVAGTGDFGYSGDGGLATDAAINNPAGMAIDASGVMYIADTDNQRIRRVLLDGIFMDGFESAQ